MLDARPLDHPPEDQLVLPLREKLIDEADEGLMDIVLRHGRADTVDISACQGNHPVNLGPDPNSGIQSP